MNRVWYIVGALALLILLVPVGVSFWVNAYLRSPEFVELVAGETGKATQTEATFGPFEWTGTSAYSERASLQGRGGAVQNLEARQVRASVNWRAIFQGVWRLDELQIASLEGTFVEPEERPPVSSKSPAQASGWLPTKFELGGARIADADLAIGTARLTDTKLEIRPDGRGWSFSGKGGRLHVPGFPEADVTDFRARTQGGEFFLTQANLRLGAGGKISLSGATNERRLRASWSGVRMADIQNFPGKEHVFGMLSGDATANPGETTGKLQLHEGRIDNLPVLNQVAEFTRTPSFRSLPIQDGSADFRRTSAGWDFRNVNIESRGLLRLEGAINVGADRSLAGNFRVGVAPQTLRWLPGSRERVFDEERDGYVWTTLTVGGTLDHPTEDLSGRLVDAMGQAVIDTGASILENAPERAIDGAKGILDILLPTRP